MTIITTRIADLEDEVVRRLMHYETMGQQIAALEARAEKAECKRDEALAEAEHHIAELEREREQKIEAWIERDEALAENDRLRGKEADNENR